MAAELPNLAAIIATIPPNPGCYMYFDENDKIIYVGKAKNLKKRVSQYFNKAQRDPKTRIMVRKIRNIRYLVVETEEDAYLLENSLIKEYKPHYNILLKDDKTYPWIVVKRESFPRIYLTRKKERDKSRYYGPYSSVVNVRYLLTLITSMYPVRICKYNLAPDNIAKGKFLPCLQYHIKKCEAPCIGLQTEEEYMRNIRSIEEILKGNLEEVSRMLYDQMLELAQELRFEEAEAIKEKYEMLKNYSAKSVIVNPSLNNVDVFSFDSSSSAFYINYLHIKSGSIIQGYSIEYKKQLDETQESILSMAIVEMRNRFDSHARKIIVPFLPDMELNDVEFIIPQRGDKKKLLDLSEKNVRQFKADQLLQAEKLAADQRYLRILRTLQQDLHLQELPMHIECFDNSNIQGTNPVSSCVVFRKARPAKRDYRTFNVKTVVGPDDFSTMYEVVSRRYRRMMDEGRPFPQLIVIDGGKGQLHAAVRALTDLGIYGQIPVIGIAKRLEEIYFPNDPIPLYLDKNSESLRLIQQIRDEAHRFGINFHRDKRSKYQLTSELDSIKGIGKETKAILLNHFKSVKRITEASTEEIVRLIGKSRTEMLLKGLEKSEVK
jgi:excinuclease ABC subunit C